MKTSPKSIHNPKYQQLISKLVDVRKSKNITQRDLAKILNTSHCYVGRLETFERRLDILEIIDLCKALGLSKQEILNLIEDLI